jgi:hypothetical protein
MRQAYAALTADDLRELVEHGISPLDIVCARLVGVARISHLADTGCYERDPTGGWAFVTPVMVDYPDTPETPDPVGFSRYGNLIDLVAWDPRNPRQWTLRVGNATWLGCIPPQYLDPEPVRIWRSVLNWLRAGCTGMVPLSHDLATTYSLLMGFPGGIEAEDEVHAAELRRILERPWPLPSISIGAPLACEAMHATG